MLKKTKRNSKRQKTAKFKVKRQMDLWVQRQNTMYAPHLHTIKYQRPHKTLTRESSRKHNQGFYLEIELSKACCLKA